MHARNLGADHARIITHYGRTWKKTRVLLIGYSFGADVLPFLVTRLPEAMRARVSRVTLLGLSAQASFEFRAATWFGGGGDARYPTGPEIARLTVPVTCVHGRGEGDSGCLALAAARVRIEAVGEGHHFGGDYARLVALALQ